MKDGEITRAPAILLKPSTSISVGRICFGSTSTPTRIFDRGGELGTAEALNRDMADTAVLGGSVNRSLKIIHHGIDIGLRRLGCSGGRHEAAAQLGDGLFPHLRILTSLTQVHGVHGNTARPILGVVAFHATRVDHVGEQLAVTCARRCLAIRGTGREGEPSHGRASTDSHQHTLHRRSVLAHSRTLICIPHYCIAAANCGRAIDVGAPFDFAIDQRGALGSIVADVGRSYGDCVSDRDAGRSVPQSASH